MTLHILINAHAPNAETKLFTPAPLAPGKHERGFILNSRSGQRPTTCATVYSISTARCHPFTFDWV